MDTRLPITVVIPTYRRESVLLDTLEAFLALEARAAEIVVVDQTERHDPATQRRLEAMEAAGAIIRVTTAPPSIPMAMNAGLGRAGQPLVLFADDDVLPEPALLAAHLQAHDRHPDILVAGRVIQPWQEGKRYPDDGPFHFASPGRRWIGEFMGGNFSVARRTALELGGFDENFVRVAYRFEAEFAYRFLASGRRILYEPEACLHHLKAAAGGTRTFGEHLRTARPDHAVGAYYYCLRTWSSRASRREFLRRPFGSIATRHHLFHPWWIPVTLVAELSGIAWAIALAARGPRCLAGLAPEPAAAGKED